MSDSMRPSAFDSYCDEIDRLTRELIETKRIYGEERDVWLAGAQAMALDAREEELVAVREELCSLETAGIRAAAHTGSNAGHGTNVGLRDAIRVINAHLMHLASVKP